jgi:hypothetical protein
MTYRVLQKLQTCGMLGIVAACGVTSSAPTQIDSGFVEGAALVDGGSTAEPMPAPPPEGPRGCDAETWKDRKSPRPTLAGCQWSASGSVLCTCDQSECPVNVTGEPSSTDSDCAVRLTAGTCSEGLLRACGLQIGSNGFCRGGYGDCWHDDDGTHTCRCYRSAELIKSSSHDCGRALRVCNPSPDDDAGA